MTSTQLEMFGERHPEVVETRARITERRDPTAATQAVVYQSPGQPMIPTWDAANALRFGYYANTFVYRCIQCKAQDISSLPIRVGADPDKPGDYDPKHPLARLLGPPPGGPNRTTSARTLIGWSVAQLYATGRIAWEMEQPPGGGTPLAFWPLAAPYLKAIPSSSGARYFDKFQYGRYGEEKTLSAEKVFYHWRPRQEDWRQPESVLDAARLDVSVAVMQDRYDVAFLRNDARPAAIVVYEGFATADEDNAFKRSFRSQFQGPDNAGHALFVEADRDGEGGIGGALDVKTLGLNAKDGKFIERYSTKIRAITVAFGVPLTRLGDASNRTFANAGEEYHVYWTSLVPDLYELADAINMNIAPLFGDNVCWFDLSKVEALKPANRFSIPEAIQAYEAQLITKNETRNEIGYDPIDGGDVFSPQPILDTTPSEPVPGSVGRSAAGASVVAPTVTPAVHGPEPAPLITAPGPSRAMLSHAYQDNPQTGKCAQCGMTKTQHAKMGTGYAAPDPELRHAQRRARAVVASTFHIDALENTWKRAFVRLFHAQARETLRRLEGKRGRQAMRESRAPEPDAVFDRDHWRDVTAQDAQDLVEAAFAAGAGRVASEFGVSFDVNAPYVRAFIEARANKLAGHVTDTTYEAIQSALADGAAAGETIAEIADRVRAVFDKATGYRAEMIARTEVVSAYNGSAATVAAQLPGDVVGGQEWIAVEDDRTREAHAAADGQTVTIGDTFDVDGEALAYPGDPNGSTENIINCRCTIAFLTPEEMDQRTKARFIEARAAKLAIALVVSGTPIDELALRRALRETRAA